jgi:hypothetical protein
MSWEPRFTSPLGEAGSRRRREPGGVRLQTTTPRIVFGDPTLPFEGREKRACE